MKDPPTASQTPNEQMGRLTKQKRLKDTTPREGGKKNSMISGIPKRSKNHKIYKSL